MRFLLGLLAVFFVPVAPAQAGPNADWSYVEKKLKAARFDKKFIADLKKFYDPKDFQSTVRLNLLLYLRKTDYHAVQISEEAVDNIQIFLRKNAAVFDAGEKQNGVSRSVIASLLWMESRHGRNYGNYHVPSVFLHLLQADRKDVIAYLHEKGPDYAKAPLTPRQKKNIIKRTKTKSDWALAELKAIQHMYRKDSMMAMRLHGSFAGAFGMSQFLPSSYKVWARSFDKKRKAPNLFEAPDAIFSVGYYLKDNGWRQKTQATHVKALMRYNNSRDYAEAILKMASLAEGPRVRRVPASLNFVDL